MFNTCSVFPVIVFIEMCVKDVNLLAQYKLVHMDSETLDLKPTGKDIKCI